MVSLSVLSRRPLTSRLNASTHCSGLIGDVRLDDDVAGRSWVSYATERMEGIGTHYDWGGFTTHYHLYIVDGERVPRIDLFNSDGQFLRNLIPPDISCVFPETVAWSPDGRFITFIAHKRAMPSPSPTPPEPERAVEPPPDPQLLPSPVASPSIAPLFPPVASFQTEQIYICNRDGYDLKPLTIREGLIYFYYAWAPDSSTLVALACKEDEWNARERQYKMPAGRPRLIVVPDGGERLLDDALTEALPVWSPDASKVATAFETDVAIYDVGGSTPTQGRIPLSDQLIAASVSYEERSGAKKANASPAPDSASPAPTSASTVPPSFNPIVGLEWPTPETLYFKTAYVRVMPSETINTFQRWHQLNLSAQAAILK